MTQATDERGIGKRELLEFAQQLSQHNSADINELQSPHAAIAAADRTAAEAQTESFARHMAEHQVCADNNECMLQRALGELRQHHQIPTTPTPPPATEAIRQTLRQTADQIHGRINQYMQTLAGGLANATREAIVGMQTNTDKVYHRC